MIAHGLFCKCAEQFGVEVVALFLLWFVFFGLDPVGICVGVLPDAGNLPGNFHVRLARSNHKTIVIHLLGHDGLGELAHYSQLIAEITIQGFKVFW